MNNDGNESNLTGQVAGIIAMVSALVKTLPPSSRKRLLHQIHTEFDALLAAMSSTGGSQAQAEREGVAWMRDLLLKRIAQADSKTVRRKGSKASADSARGATSTPAEGKEQSSSKPVDFEL